jgi:hypothetical protein
MLFGRIKVCLLYEIVKNNDYQAPLIWDSRIFMAIGVSISPHRVNERKVAVKLISVKSHKFTGVKEEVKALHENVLYRFMNTYGQKSQWNIEEMGLALEVGFNRKANAKLRVRLSRVMGLSKEVPIFYSYGDFV